MTSTRKTASLLMQDLDAKVTTSIPYTVLVLVNCSLGHFTSRYGDLVLPQLCQIGEPCHPHKRQGTIPVLSVSTALNFRSNCTWLPVLW